MPSFELHTEILFNFFAPHPMGVSRIGDTYPDEDFPHWFGSGLIFRENKEVQEWNIAVGESLEKPFLPSSITINSQDRVFTSHGILVSNRLDTGDADPCLKVAPIITETLPNLFAGIVDTQAVNFTLSNPRWQRFLGDDFVPTNGTVVIFRGFRDSLIPVWRGIMTKVNFKGPESTIFARPDIKKLDQKATFGHDGRIINWSPEHKIPVICARLIPYSTRVLRHSPQVVSPYVDWRKDYANFLRDFPLPPEEENG